MGAVAFEQLESFIEHQEKSLSDFRKWKKCFKLRVSKKLNDRS